MLPRRLGACPPRPSSSSHELQGQALPVDVRPLARTILLGGVHNRRQGAQHPLGAL